MLLYQPPLSEPGRARLDALVETTDGFVIAERDLALRGPGDFFGTRQSGLPTLRVGDLLRDHALMEEARREAVAWLDAGAGAQSLVQYLSANWAQRFGLVGRRVAAMEAARVRIAARAPIAHRSTDVLREDHRGPLKGRRLVAPRGAPCARRPTGCAKRCST